MWQDYISYVARYGTKVHSATCNCYPATLYTYTLMHRYRLLDIRCNSNSIVLLCYVHISGKDVTATCNCYSVTLSTHTDSSSLTHLLHCYTAKVTGHQILRYYCQHTPRYQLLHCCSATQAHSHITKMLAVILLCCYMRTLPSYQGYWFVYYQDTSAGCKREEFNDLCTIM